MGDLSSNVPCQNQCGNLSHVAERSMGHEGSKDKMTTRTRAAQDSLHNKYTRCLRKNCAKLFLSELRQLFINFNDLGDLDEKMAEILCYTYIFHLTSLTLSHYLVKYKSTKFYSFSGKLGNNSVRTLFYFHQFNNFWQIHDKIAETLCLVLEVCLAPRTQALDDAQLAAIAASMIDCMVKASQLVDRTHFKFVDVSYSGLVNFPLHKAYTPDTMVVWVQTRWHYPIPYPITDTRAVFIFSLVDSMLMNIHV